MGCSGSSPVPEVDAQSVTVVSTKKHGDGVRAQDVKIEKTASAHASFKLAASEITCVACGSSLGLGKLAEEGHQWNGHPACTFNRFASRNIRFGPTRKVNMIQGQGAVCNTSCTSCNTTVGWKIISSPIAQQNGALGFMLPCVRIQDDGSLPLALAPPVDELDKLAVSFMAKHGIAGLSATFHVQKSGQTIRRGWGYATADGSGVPMLPSTPLRIASISKCLTGVAVLRLVEAGKLNLNAPAMPLVAAALGNDNLVKKATDARTAKITVRHLLHHVCGGWSNEPNCPMFRYQPIPRTELIPRILAEEALKEAPGARYAYSNFGYCLLGRVVEAACSDGRSYEQFVQDEILQPCGIDNAYVGDRNEANVGYYTSRPSGTESHVFMLSQSRVSGAQVQRMDSHGGWEMSTDDLIRFTRALDQGKLLREETVAHMFTPLPQSKGYGLGWCTNKYGARWHAGALEGTASILVKTTQHGGMTWALATNTTAQQKAEFSELDPFAWSCVNAVLRLARGRASV